MSAHTKAMTVFLKEIEAREAELSEQLKRMRGDALKRFAAIKGPSTLHQMHAYIGGNNNTFVDSVRMKFKSPRDFIANWLNGLTHLVNERRTQIARRRRFGDAKRTEEIVPEMLKDELLRKYIFLFLERNFCRNYRERVRDKPDEALWQIWFGSSNLVWGLLISPARRFGEWTNDKSQMRREGYAYWTIEHVLETGLIAPDSEAPVKFRDVDDFLSFYETVLARVSSSHYELALSKRYIEYVRSSSDPTQVPLLIPELRYAGREVKHLYRLDFCVLNQYTMQMTGFEISPASSHLSVSGSARKTQKAINEELAVKWGKEAHKRNAYFKKYGITTLTFTDSELANLDRCWEHVLATLEARTNDPLTVRAAEDALRTAYASIQIC